MAVPKKEDTPIFCWLLHLYSDVHQPMHIIAVVADAESVCRGSNWFCKNYAYATEVRAHLQRLEDDGETNIVAVDLSELYLKRAGAVAEQQATRAGWRLAKLLGG
ncbi:hypothetical protein N9Z70_04680 [Mariniblastus sp.]|nr:hypothetical protein [Mariniblastus sp.]